MAGGRGGDGEGELKRHIWKMAWDLDTKEAVAVTHFLTLSASLSFSFKTQGPEHLTDLVLEQPHDPTSNLEPGCCWFLAPTERSRTPLPPRSTE